jgi:hypothetical protein
MVCKTGFPRRPLVLRYMRNTFSARCWYMIALILVWESVSAFEQSARLAAQDNKSKIPPDSRQPPAITNLFTGDGRIAAKRFHVVLAFDTDHSNHTGAQHSLDLLQEVIEHFSRGFSEEALKRNEALPGLFSIAANTIILRGADLTRQNLLDVPNRLKRPTDRADLSRLQLKKDDVLFFWSETEGNASGELLLSHGPPITRDELRQAMEVPDSNGDRMTSLTVFITDNCRTAPGKAGVDREPLESNIWRALYFGHVGTVDIASTDFGKPAFASDGASFLARAFRNAFIDADLVNRLDTKPLPPGDGLVEWQDEFMDHLQSKSSEVFSEHYKTLAVDDYFAIGKARPKLQISSLSPKKQAVVKAMKEAQGQVPQLNPKVEFSVRRATPQAGR